MKFIIYALLCMALVPVSIFAQADDETIKIDTRLVEVPVVVTDKTGRPVMNLKRSNFVVYEDGKPQDIAEFATTSAPFEVALVLDTSGSTRSELELIKRAATEFIASLRAGDRVSIISFKVERTESEAHSVSEVLCPLTSDRTVLKKALERIQTSNSTPYYDALLKVAETVFSTKPSAEFRGRRAIVALTDGVDSASAVEFDAARESLESGGIMSFFIKLDTREFFEENLMGDCQFATRMSPTQIRRFYRTYYPRARVEKTFDFCKLGDFERLEISKGLYEIAGKELDELAKRSGGRVFPAADLNEARTAFRSVANEIGTKYSLGYYPSNETRDGSFRTIRVELKNVPAGTTVRAREGYNAK